MSLNSIITNLRTDSAYRAKLDTVINLAKSPFVQTLISSFNADLSIIDTIYEALINDTVSP